MEPHQWPEVQSDEAARIRQKVSRDLIRWNINMLGHDVIAHYHHYQNMARLFGFDSYDQMHEAWNPEIAETLKGLAGPHGYTIAKAMEARRKK